MSDTSLFLISHSEPFIYAGLFLILFLAGLGLPIPEEITLLTGGFFIHQGLVRLYPTLTIGFLGVLIGDLVVFSIGRKWGHGIITHQHLHRVFTESRLERVRQFFRQHGSKTIFVARFISGFRVAAFLAAGTMGVNLGKFLFLDFLGALILVPLLILLGYYLLKILTVLAILAAVGFYLWKRKKSPPRP